MTAETRLFGTVTIPDEKLITFPEGIVGFPFMKHFALIHDADNANSSIMWLQSMEETEFAMPVMEPVLIDENYNPMIDDEYLLPLGKMDNEQLYSLVTITVPSEIENMTANFKAPIIINMVNNCAVQIIVEDDYQIKHPIYETLKKRKEGVVC